MTQCSAKTRNGQPCRAQALKGRRFCFTHDPAQGAARAKARRRGGERRRVRHAGDSSLMPAQVRTVADTLALLDYGLAEALPLENSVQRVRLLIALADGYLRAFEAGEIGHRLQQLEQRSAARLMTWKEFISLDQDPDLEEGRAYLEEEPEVPINMVAQDDRKSDERD